MVNLERFLGILFFEEQSLCPRITTYKKFLILLEPLTTMTLDLSSSPTVIFPEPLSTQPPLRDIYPPLMHL